MRASDITRKLWYSEEATICRQNLIGHLVLNVILTVGLAILAISCGEGLSDTQLVWQVSMIACGVILLPGILQYSWWLIRIFRHREHYSFHTATLTEPQGSLFGRACFYMTLEDPQMGVFVAKTHRIFWFLESTSRRAWFFSFFLVPFVEDYHRKTVTVAYNKKSGRAVIIDQRPRCVE